MPTDSSPAFESLALSPIHGQEPSIIVRRGLRGAGVGEHWIPLPIRGGDGTEDGTGADASPVAEASPDEPSASAGPPETFSRDYVEQLRREAADHRRRAAQAESKLKEHETAKLSETERLQQERDEYKSKLETVEAQARARIIRSEIRVAAGALQFADPDDAWRFVDQAAIEIDDNGEPTNVKALLETLLKAKPYLRAASESPRAGVPATPKAQGQPSREEAIRARMEQLKASGQYSRL